MDEIKMEREIKEMLHQCADELHAPDSMQARVKFALNNAPARKRHLWSKRFVAVAAVAAIAVTGAVVAGGMGGIFSKGWSDQRLDLSSTQAHLADAGVVLTLPDKIGEYTFSYGSDVDTTAQNDMGETEKVSEVDATYTKDGAELNLSAHKSYTVFTEDEMENPVPATTAEVNGVTLTFSLRDLVSDGVDQYRRQSGLPKGNTVFRFDLIPVFSNSELSAQEQAAYTL